MRECRLTFRATDLTLLTSSPLLLARKAQQKRQETGEPRYYAPFEREEWPIKARVYHVLVRPWVIFFQEPMLVSLTLYMSVCLAYYTLRSCN